MPFVIVLLLSALCTAWTAPAAAQSADAPPQPEPPAESPTEESPAEESPTEDVPAPTAPAPTPSPAAGERPAVERPAGQPSEPIAPAAPSAEPSTADAPAPGARGADQPPPAEAPAPEDADGPVEELELSAEELAELTAVAEGEPAAATGEPAAATAEGDAGADAEGEVLEQLSIIGSAERAARVGGSATVIDEDALQRMEQDDIHRVLEAAPGVYVRSEDGFGLRPNIGIRGASSDRSRKVTLMEDGVLFGPAPYSAPAAYFFPLVTRMTAVEVFKGPASIRYGPQTIGGALNMTTRAVPTASSGGIDLSLGRFRSGKAHGYWGGRFGDFGVLLEGVHLRSDGFKELDGGGNTGFAKNEAMVKLQYRGDSGADVYHQFDLKLGYADELSNETYLGLSRSDFAANGLRRYRASARDQMDWWRTQVQLDYLLAIGDALTVRTTLYRHDFDRVWNRLNRFDTGAPLGDVLADPDSNAFLYQVLTGAEDSAGQRLLTVANDRRFVSQGLQSTLNWDGTTGPLSHSLEVGARLHFDRVKRDQRESAFAMQGGVLVPFAGDANPVTRNRAKTLALSFHVQDELGWGPLHITPGVRVEVIDAHIDDSLNGLSSERFDTVLLPGAAVHYQVSPSVGLLAGVHRGFSPVSVSASDSAEDIEPETSVNYEAGVRYRGERTRAELIGFVSDYQDLAVVCSFAMACGVESVGQQFNVGGVVTYGAEAVAGAELSLGPDLALGADLNYTLTFSRFREGDANPDPTMPPAFQDFREGDELPYVPRHALTGVLRAEGTKWAASVSGRYASAMRDEAGQGAFEPGADEQLVIDVSLSVFPTEAGQIYLTAQNLFDSRYIASMRPFGARPGRPLWVQVGYKHRFDP